MRFAAAIILTALLFSCNTIYYKETNCMQSLDYIPVKQLVYDSLNSDKAIALGRLLFFEKALSKDSSVSCASCHKPEFAFADNVPISPGTADRIGFRNAPSLANVKYQPYFFHDGGAITLEMQIQGPFDNVAEFDLNILEGFDRIENDENYNKLFYDAFKSKPTMYLFTRAIALFENSLISGNSKWDKFFYQNDLQALSVSELNGWKLFQSEKLGCTNCHNGFNFTNYTFQNIGFGASEIDWGRARITNQQEDMGKFKVPSLRNLGFTAPYMHNGALKNLEEVVAHYETLEDSVLQRNTLLKKISLSNDERLDLIHFLEALNDSGFVQCQSSL